MVHITTNITFPRNKWNWFPFCGFSSTLVCTSVTHKYIHFVIRITESLSWKEWKLCVWGMKDLQEEIWIESRERWGDVFVVFVTHRNIGNNMDIEGTNLIYYWIPKEREERKMSSKICNRNFLILSHTTNQLRSIYNNFFFIYSLLSIHFVEYFFPCVILILIFTTFFPSFHFSHHRIH